MSKVNFSAFGLGSVSTLAVDTAQQTQGFVDVSTLNLNDSIIVSLIGGVVATVVLNILKSKFPRLFEPLKSKTKDNNGEGKL